MCDRDENVDLTAPLKFNEYVFRKWTVAGSDQPDGQHTISIIMRTDKTAVAIYQLPEPTIWPEEDTQCPVVATTCPENLATVCPLIDTACPLAETACPAIDTECPAVDTSCPAISTQCPEADLHRHREL